AERVEANEDASIRLASQSTAAADAGTEMLSSRRTGIVSTNAATIAAASVAATVNETGGIRSTAGRAHSASATPPSPPKRLNASATAASPEACHGVKTRSSSANSPAPTWTHCLPSSACIANRRNRRVQSVGERRHRVAELADRLRAVERPVVPENLHGPARD